MFIRVEKDKVASASGSGFLIRVDGETGYVVTNHHVVHLTAKVAVQVPYFPGPRLMPPRLGPRFPTPPRFPGPLGPGVEHRTEVREVAIPHPAITLVFGSGTRQERSATGYC